MITKTGQSTLYSPPLRFEELPKHLQDDELHAWRAKNGIELIHKEPTLTELNRIIQNYKLMPRKLKVISDLKSKDLFGMGNLQHAKVLLRQYQD